MFIHSKKSLEIREGDNKITISAGFVGDIPDWAAKHWYVKAAISDGTIVTTGGAEGEVPKKGRKAVTTEPTAEQATEPAEGDSGQTE